ncbi:hypothetical protein SSS_10188 [Sarcoptes scabiei]|uniref:Uncharacterized protein n=1 Tax=Sarcoptes scabiei TaxID=52283 RepID=A0A834R7X0_SARSC|nr:hypothetical protein SSS_10188 [Sarcoptes scabiei]
MSFASQHGGSGDHFMATNNFSNKGPMVPIRPMKENETIQSFIRIFDNWAKANCWDDQESARIFKALIEDDQISSKIEKCSGNESFENIKKDLLTISKSARDRKFIELRSLKLGIEDDVDNLYHQISKLIDDCYNERVDPNQLKRDFFLSSIDARIRSKLFINQELPDDIIDLKNLVKGLMVIEKEITTKSLPKKSNNGGKWCDVCKKRNHNTEECYSKKRTENLNCANTHLQGPSKRYFIKMEVNGNKIEALFDTGSNRSIIADTIVRPQENSKKNVVQQLKCYIIDNWQNECENQNWRI